VRFAICCLNHRVAPLINHTKEIIVVSKEQKNISLKEIEMTSCRALDILKVLKDKKVKILICGGIKEEYSQLLEKNNIKIIKNVIDDIDNVVRMYLDGDIQSMDTKRIKIAK